MAQNTKKDAQWVPVEVDELIAGWLADLPWGVRATWVALKCYVRAMGNGRGSCKAPSTARFANTYGIPHADAEALIEAAVEAGALREEGGKWIVMDADAVQTPDAARKRKQREVAECPDAPQAEERPNAETPIVTDGPKPTVTSVDDPSQTAFVPDKTETSGTNADILDSLLRGEENRTEQKTTTTAGAGEREEPPPDTGPPWKDHPDRLVTEVGETIMAVPKFAAVGYPAIGRIEKIVSDNRDKAPNDDAIRYELDNWVTYNSNNPRKGGSTDGVAGLRNWLGNCHARWAMARKRLAQNPVPVRAGKSLPATAEGALAYAMELEGVALV